MFYPTAPAGTDPAVWYSIRGYTPPPPKLSAPPTHAPTYQAPPEAVEHDGAVPPPGILADPTALNTANQAQSQLPGLINKVGSQIMGAISSQQYPSYQNSMGLGSQQPFGKAQAESGATSRGFNPWSLVGEANSR